MFSPLTALVIALRNYHKKNTFFSTLMCVINLSQYRKLREKNQLNVESLLMHKTITNW